MEPCTIAKNGIYHGFNVYPDAYKELFQSFEFKLQNLGYYGEPYKQTPHVK